MWSFGNLARTHHYPSSHFMGYGHGGYGRSNYAGLSDDKKSAMADAAINKGTAVLVAGITGGISAYKGLPMVNGNHHLGLDLGLGLLLAAAEFGMLYKGGMNSKWVAAVGGASTGFLCHYAAVEGTILGASKARAEGLPGPTIGVAGWDDRNYGEPAPLPPGNRVPPVPAAAARAPARAPAFDTNYGMM